MSSLICKGLLPSSRVQSFKCFVRTLKLMESGEVNLPPPPPFDYMGKYFSLLRSMRDPTTARLNENSKVIAVEGNIACGKSLLASKLAGYFGMQYIPDVTEDDIYLSHTHDPPFDLRWHNALLPPDARYFTCDMFWNCEDLQLKGKPLYLQWQFYVRRYWKYLKGLCALFNTGHGFITERSPFSELAFSDAMYECGYLSERAHRWFNQHHGITSKNLWKPHLVIYVKTPIQQIRENLKKRNIPWEMNGRNLTDKFLDTYTQTLERNYLDRMSRYSEIMVVDGSNTDVHDEDDVRIIAKKISELDLTGARLMRDDYKFLEWRMGLFIGMAKATTRAIFSDSFSSFEQHFNTIEVPSDMHEFRYKHDAREMQAEVLRMDPRTVYPPSFNRRYQSLFNIMFNPFLMKKNYERDLPKNFLWV